MATSLLVLLDDITTVLDDVATMTKVAAKKTAGVLGDDLALNAQQVTGVNANRELPVVWAVAKGSLVNKVRFTAPVPVGSRLRAAFKLLALDDVAGGARQLTVEVAIEREGSAKPVCVAESLARHYR